MTNNNQKTWVHGFWPMAIWLNKKHLGNSEPVIGLASFWWQSAMFFLSVTPAQGDWWFHHAFDLGQFVLFGHGRYAESRANREILNKYQACKPQKSAEDISLFHSCNSRSQHFCGKKPKEQAHDHWRGMVPVNYVSSEIVVRIWLKKTSQPRSNLLIQMMLQLSMPWASTSQTWWLMMFDIGYHP